jgi:hypothetical protein
VLVAAEPVFAPLLVPQVRGGRSGSARSYFPQPSASPTAPTEEEEVDAVIDPVVVELVLKLRLLVAAPGDHRAADALGGDSARPSALLHRRRS